MALSSLSPEPAKAHSVAVGNLWNWRNKAPHSKLWGITGRETTPPQVTDEATFIPPVLPWEERVFSGNFYKFAERMVNARSNLFQPFLRRANRVAWSPFIQTHFSIRIESVLSLFLKHFAKKVVDNTAIPVLFSAWLTYSLRFGATSRRVPWLSLAPQLFLLA